MTTAQILAKNITLLTTNGVNTQDFLKLTAANAQQAVDNLSQPIATRSCPTYRPMG